MAGRQSASGRMHGRGRARPDPPARERPRGQRAGCRSPSRRAPDPGTGLIARRCIGPTAGWGADRPLLRPGAPRHGWVPWAEVRPAGAGFDGAQPGERLSGRSDEPRPRAHVRAQAPERPHHLGPPIIAPRSQIGFPVLALDTRPHPGRPRSAARDAHGSSLGVDVSFPRRTYHHAISFPPRPRLPARPAALGRRGRVQRIRRRKR